MQIRFVDDSSAPAARIIAHLVNQDAMPAGLEPVLVEAAKMSRFAGKAGQMFEGFVERGGKVVRVALAGIGAPSAEDRRSAIEKAGAALAAKYQSAGEDELLLDLSGLGLSADEAAAALLGARLRAWRHDVYRTKLTDDKKPSLTSIAVKGAPGGTQAKWEVEAAVAEGVEFTKQLITEPANQLYPESFVARCEAAMEGTGLSLRVLHPDEMRRLGMGALLGVAQGSAREPRLLVMEWQGGKKDERPLALVGKGVTFDTGGISLKPPAGMEDMKWDMGGAGVVAGTMLALAKRGAKANVVGFCGLVENMPDGNAQRPGDVVTSMSGQTIEVINTDAEGRLVLCDVLTYAQREFNPAAIIDLATLTGAMIVALAHEYGGMFSNDEELAAKIDKAGKATGDMVWRFPLGKAYDKMIDSQIADMKNMGARFGGSITAAQFLQRFIEDKRPWAHLDIAGMVWADKPGATWDKGATGYGVRLMDAFVRENLEG
ncbi:MAG: leucyl aminopeptidase [Novosphingobium sp.]|nr:leucyl aminopeptidase [Novosphingobium sp.]